MEKGRRLAQLFEQHAQFITIAASHFFVRTFMRQVADFKQPAPEPVSRLDHLDGLRGIAAVIVLCSHMLEIIARDFAQHRWAQLINHPMLDYVGFGRTGVVAFFCVSGFVIPFSLTPRRGITGFVISRFFRLYPAYWLSIALATTLAIVVGRAAPSLTSTLTNMTMFQAALGQADIISVYWTLFYELIFYVFCAILFFSRLLENSVVILLIVLSLIAVAVASSAARYFLAINLPIGIPLYLSIMFFGTLYRHAILLGDRMAARAWRPVLLVVVIAVPIVGVLGFSRGPMPDRPWADLIATYLGLGLFFAAFRFRKWFAQPVLIWLGAVSYSLYLLHPLTIEVALILSRFVSPHYFSLIVIMFGFPLSLLAARLVWIAVERPAIRLGRHLDKLRAQQPHISGGS